MTNFEKIKQMQVKEFVYELFHMTNHCEFAKKRKKATLCPKVDYEGGLCPCDQCLVKWLESEADTEQREEKDDAEIH